MSWHIRVTKAAACGADDHQSGSNRQLFISHRFCTLLARRFWSSCGDHIPCLYYSGLSNYAPAPLLSLTSQLKEQDMPRRRPPRAGALNDLSPVKLATQIAILQVAYYLVAFVLIAFTTLVAGQAFGFGTILDWQTIRGDNTVGWTLGLCWMLDAGVWCVHSPLIFLSEQSVG
jgi:hypothetical protein